MFCFKGKLPLSDLCIKRDHSNHKLALRSLKLKNVIRATGVSCTVLLTLGISTSYAVGIKPILATPINVWHGINNAGGRFWAFQYADGTVADQSAKEYGFAYNEPSDTLDGTWAWATPGSLLFNKWDVAGVINYDSGAYINRSGAIVGLDWRSHFSASPDDWTTASYYYDLLYKALPSGDMNKQGNDNDAWKVTYVNQTRDPITLYLNKTRLQSWGGNAGPDEIVVNPCTEVTQDYVRNIPSSLSGSALTVFQYYMGSLAYNVVGPYTGAAVLLADWYDPIGSTSVQFSSGQNASGSTDWVGMDSGLPMCGPGQDYNCVESLFTTPKNVASSSYSGGHGMALRRYSSAFSQTNEAIFVFKPRNTTDTCGLTQGGFLAYLTNQFPKALVAHPDRFILENGKNLKDTFPNINPSLISGGVFTNNWGINNQHGLPTFSIDQKDVKVESDKQTEPGTITWLSSAADKLKNPTDVSQTLSSSAYSHTVSVSSSTTTTHSWANQEGGKVTATVGGSAGVPGDTVNVSASVEISYSHTDTQGDSQTCTTTVSDTYTAPAQAIFIPPHHEADVIWRFGIGNVSVPYSFQATLPNDIAITGEMGGRLVSIPDEWHHPGRYQAYDSDMVVIKPTRFTTDLYTLIDPAYGNALPDGLTWDAKNKVFLLNGSGTANIEGASILQVSVTMYDLDNQGNPVPNTGKTTNYNVPFDKQTLLNADPTTKCS